MSIRPCFICQFDSVVNSVLQGPSLASPGPWSSWNWSDIKRLRNQSPCNKVLHWALHMKHDSRFGLVGQFSVLISIYFYDYFESLEAKIVHSWMCSIKFLWVPWNVPCFSSQSFLLLLAWQTTEKNLENFPGSLKYDAKHWDIQLISEHVLV